ncbi:MAG: hypothetical protein WEA09_04275 [Gemmatimonadota bacterium]
MRYAGWVAWAWLLPAAGLFGPVPTLQGQDRTQTEATADISGNPIAGFVHHPRWPGGSPRFLLPSRPVSVELWGLALEDRWGPDRSRTPHLRALPLIPMLGFRSGGGPVPSALLTGGVLESGALSLTSILPREGWVGRALGGYHALSLTGTFREGEDRRQWPEFQEGNLSVAGGGWIWPQELAVEGGVEHRRVHRADWGNSYEQSGEGVVGIPLDDAILFRDILRVREGRVRDGDLLARDLRHHATSVGGRGLWLPSGRLEVSLAALGYVAHDSDDLRTNPFALDGSFPALTSRGGVGRAAVNWQPLAALEVEGAVSARHLEEHGGAPSGAPEVLAVRPIPLPGGGLGSRTLLAGVPWMAQGDTLRETDLGLDAQVTFVRGAVELQVGGALGGTELARVQRPGSLGRYIYTEAGGLDAGAPEWSERVIYTGTQGTARAHILRGALRTDVRVGLPSGVWLEGGIEVEQVRYPRVAGANLVTADAIGVGALARPHSDPILLPRVAVRWEPEGAVGPGVWAAGGFRREELPYTLLLAAYRDGESLRVECRLPVQGPLMKAPDPTCPGAAGRREDPTGTGAVVFRPGYRDPVWVRGEVGARWQGNGWGGEFVWEEGWTRWEPVVRMLSQEGGSGIDPHGEAMQPPLASVVGIGSAEGATVRRFHLGVHGEWAGFRADVEGVRRLSRSRASWESADPLQRLALTPVLGAALPALAPDRLDSGDWISAGLQRESLDGAVSLGIRYHQRSGVPFTWVIQGDLNGDGVSGNDVLTVPPTDAPPRFRRSEDLQAFQGLLASDRCLQSIQNGALATNRCRAATIRQLDVQGRFMLPLAGWTVTLAVENLTGGLSRKWGRVEVPPATVPLLRLVDRDSESGEAIFDLTVPNRDNWVLRPQSMWRARIGMEVRLP